MDESKLTSNDILEQIKDLASGLDEGGEEEEPQQEQYYAEPDSEEQYDEELADLYENEALDKKRYQEEGTAWMQDQFNKTGRIPQPGEYPSLEDWKENKDFFQLQHAQQDIQKALQEDLLALSDRYPRAINHFIAKMNRGQVNIPEGIEAEPNALEQLLIQSVVEDARKFDAETLAEVIGYAETEDERRPPLRTRSLDIAEPRRLPRKQVSVKRPRQTVVPTNYTNEEIHEIWMHGFVNFQKNHPEKFRG